MRRWSAPLPALALALGCQPQPLPLDAGGEAGMRRALPSCASPLVVAGTTGTVSVPIDTRGGVPGSVPLPTPAGTDSCTSSSAERAPQVVIAYDVPGTGPQAITVSTVNPGTDGNYDTVIAVRGPQCWPRSVSEPPLRCYDDETGTRDFRSRGAFVAEGGERVFLIVTGYGAMSGGRSDEGLAQLDITAGPVTAPTIDEASVLVTPSSIRVDVRGGDAGRDAVGVRVSFHGPAGEPIDRNGDGAFDARDEASGAFDRPVLGVTTFAETATIAEALTGGAAFVRVRIVDRAGVASERSISVAPRVGAVVGIGEPCDATSVCGPELACGGMGVCAPAVDRALACTSPTLIVLMAPPDGMATTTTRQSVLTAGPGLFTAPSTCGDSTAAASASGGREDVFLIQVPAGRYDLLLTTDSPGTAGASPREPDTILYVRRDCVDARSAAPAECNDDIATGENQRSTVVLEDVSDVTVAAFVEVYNGAPDGEGVRYELGMTLRPVLGSGEVCDPAGRLSRCAVGECPIATRRCP
jgi:hypothetical protein